MSETKLDPKKMKEALESPDAYVERMEREGRSDELTSADRMRASSSKAVKTLAGMIGLGEKKGQ